MPSIVCTVMVGLFCLEGSVTKSVDDDDPLLRRVTVSAANYTASASWGDLITTPDWRRMNEACVDGFCVRYIKHCTESVGATRCSYQVGRPGDDDATTLFIQELTKGGIVEAEHSISFLSDEESLGRRVPLSTLAIESNDEDAPVCPREEFPCMPKGNAGANVAFRSINDERMSTQLEAQRLGWKFDVKERAGDAYDISATAPDGQVVGAHCSRRDLEATLESMAREALALAGMTR